MTVEWTATEAGERLDKLLARVLTETDAQGETISRVRVQQAIKDGKVAVNGKAAKAAYRVAIGDRVQILPLDPIAGLAPIRPEAIPLRVIYEDALIAAIDKPAGMVVHPATGHFTGTLVNAVLNRWPQTANVGAEGRTGIVHRLDKDTSGVILIAKTERARRELAAQFKARTVQKRYLGLVHGWLDTPIGQIDAPIGRDPHQRRRMAVVRNGRPAITDYTVLQVFHELSYLELRPKTGRTHQLRVHLAFMKHPIVGDRVYGYRKSGINGDVRLNRQFLHAESLSLISPATGELITVHATLPANLQAILEALARAL